VRTRSGPLRFALREHRERPSKLRALWQCMFYERGMCFGFVQPYLSERSDQLRWRVRQRCLGSPQLRFLRNGVCPRTNLSCGRVRVFHGGNALWRKVCEHNGRPCSLWSMRLRMRRRTVMRFGRLRDRLPAGPG
jgi:hypothetical protein